MRVAGAVYQAVQTDAGILRKSGEAVDVCKIPVVHSSRRTPQRILRRDDLVYADAAALTIQGAVLLQFSYLVGAPQGADSFSAGPRVRPSATCVSSIPQ